MFVPTIKTIAKKLQLPLALPIKIFRRMLIRNQSFRVLTIRLRKPVNSWKRVLEIYNLSRKSWVHLLRIHLNPNSSVLKPYFIMHYLKTPVVNTKMMNSFPVLLTINLMVWLKMINSLSTQVRKVHSHMSLSSSNLQGQVSTIHKQSNLSRTKEGIIVLWI